MNQKIEWYKEVLSLEPNSKVFFTLARMQTEEGEHADAVATLRHGLARNPDHMEARLLLIELLMAQGDAEPLWAELEQVTMRLGGYPGFWAAWEKRLIQNPSSRDAALALSFFSAWLRNETMSWSDIIEHGLKAVLGASDVIKPASPPSLDELQNYLQKNQKDDAQEIAVSADAEGGASSSPPQAPKPVSISSPVSGTSFELESGDYPGVNSVKNTSANENQAPTAQKSSKAELSGKQLSGTQLSGSNTPSEADREKNFDLDQPVKMDGLDLDDDESSEDGEEDSFSLKTRSMAEVLAEQGDFQGALEIYEELLEHSTSDLEKEALRLAISKLCNKPAGAVVVPDSIPEDSEEDDSASEHIHGKSRILDVLETLAQRLEAKS